MLRTVVVASAALLVPGISSCSRPGAGEDGVEVDLRVSPDPPRVGDVVVEVLLADGEGEPLSATAVELEGNMAHAGMRPSFASARPDGPGRWRAELDLTMAGDWFVVVEARLEDGRTVERTLPLPGVGPR